MREFLILLGNILWFITGGFVMGLAWWLAAVIMLISIIGIPWARAAFTIGRFSFFPFGYHAVERRSLFQGTDIGSGPLGLLGNLVWFVFAGIWLCIAHLGAALVCFISIIGIPFGIQHVKLAQISLFPIGKAIVPNDAF